MIDQDQYRQAPAGDLDRVLPRLPRTHRHQLLDPQEWRAGEAAAAPLLARAALALGQLDGVLSVMAGPDRAGAVARLALVEVEALTWAAGTPIPREDLARDLLDAPAGTDLEALRLARWAVRRLQGRGDADDLRHFLGLTRTDHAASGDGEMLRLTGTGFDEAASEFALRLDPLQGSHPFTRAAYGLALWRISGLSPGDDVVESACWAARQAARSCAALTFAPIGQDGRSAWTRGGPAAERLAAWYAAIEQGATEMRQLLGRLSRWTDRAGAAGARMKGGNAEKVIAALRKVPTLSAAMVEEHAGISRDTAERLLARLAAEGLVREITGARRFRLWTAAV